MTQRIYLDQIEIYGAGKTWAAAELKRMRDEEGFNINSSWIDLEQVLTSPTDEHPKEIHENKDFLREIWDNGCLKDCTSSDMMVLLTTPADGEKHSGSIVELGIITGQNKPVYIIGTCASFEPVGHSDRAWKQQKLVTHWPEITDPLEGFTKAVNHYRRNYRNQWLGRHSLRHDMSARELQVA